MAGKRVPSANPVSVGDFQYNVYAERCPTRQVLDRIADKWTALIVGLLADRPYRFGDLRRGIEGISHKVLTQALRSLERDGLISRRVLNDASQAVEYSLTATGHTLVEPLAAIRAWAEAHIEELIAARAEKRPTPPAGDELP